MLVGGFPDRWAKKHRQLLKPRLFKKAPPTRCGSSLSHHELQQIELHRVEVHGTCCGGQVVDRLNRARRQPGVEPQLQVIV